MSITYNDDLSRVQLAYSDLGGVPAVRIERSTNELLWETVRGGVALPVSGGAASLDDYEFAADTENFYRVVPSTFPGLLLSGNSGDFASTPDHDDLDITGDIDVRAEVAADVWDTGTPQSMIAKYETSGNQRAYRFQVRSNGFLTFSWSEDGSDFINRDSTVPIPAENGERIALRAVLDVSVGINNSVVHFLTAPTINGPWTQLGNTVVNGFSTSINVSNARLTSGAQGNSGNVHMFKGTIFAAEVRDGIDGDVVANPDFTIHDHGATSFVDAEGRTWDVEGNAEIIGDTIETDSITPSLEGKIWLKSIKYPFLNRPVHLLDLVQEEAREARTEIHSVASRSTPVAVQDRKGSKQFGHVIRVADTAEARDIDLILTSGNIFLLHVPADCEAPGGYVVFTASRQRRVRHGAAPHIFELDCRVVAPPAPDIVGTTLTWGTVFKLYGGWNALINDNPTWADLLTNVGSPEDLVVI